MSRVESGGRLPARRRRRHGLRRHQKHPRRRERARTERDRPRRRRLRRRAGRSRRLHRCPTAARHRRARRPVLHDPFSEPPGRCATRQVQLRQRRIHRHTRRWQHRITRRNWLPRNGLRRIGRRGQRGHRKRAERDHGRHRDPSADKSEPTTTHDNLRHTGATHHRGTPNRGRRATRRAKLPRPHRTRPEPEPARTRRASLTWAVAPEKPRQPTAKPTRASSRRTGSNTPNREEPMPGTMTDHHRKAPTPNG
jgi:hypothetical protein